MELSDVFVSSKTRVLPTQGAAMMTHVSEHVRMRNAPLESTARESNGL